MVLSMKFDGQPQDINMLLVLPLLLGTEARRYDAGSFRALEELACLLLGP